MMSIGQLTVVAFIKMTLPGEFGFIIDEVSLLSDRTFQNET